MSFKEIINYFSICFWILQLYMLLQLYSYSKLDTFQYKLQPREKENFFIEPNDNNVVLTNDYNCMLYQDLILDKKTDKLGDVFNLNLEQIHHRLTVLLVTTILTISFLIILILIIFVIKFIPSIINSCSFLILLISIMMFICNFIILIYFFLFISAFYHGDINNYIEFLTCNNVNYLSFSRYRNIEFLKSHFKAYIIVLAISLLLSYIKECIKGER